LGLLFHPQKFGPADLLNLRARAATARQKYIRNRVLGSDDDDDDDDDDDE